LIRRAFGAQEQQTRGRQREPQMIRLCSPFLRFRSSCEKISSARFCLKPLRQFLQFRLRLGSPCESPWRAAVRDFGGGFVDDGVAGFRVAFELGDEDEAVGQDGAGEEAQIVGGDEGATGQDG
jgi:hypothetical protein